MRKLTGRILVTLAAVAFALGIVAGVANREVLDGDRFAAHVNSIRNDANVSRLIANATSERVFALDEDLLALRPAIEAAIGQLVTSDVFTPLVEATARQVHDALTKPDSKQILLRVSDAGAVLVAALKAYAPDVASRLPANLDITLGDVGAQSFAGDTLRLTRFVGLMSWLLPLLGLLLLAIALALGRPRRVLATTGTTVMAAGGLVALVYAVCAGLATRTDTSKLRGALLTASWHELRPEVWRAAVVVVGAGWVLLVAAWATWSSWSTSAVFHRVAEWLRERTDDRVHQLLTAIVLALVAVAALYRPLTAVRALVYLVALALLAEAVSRLARTFGRQTSPAPEGDAISGASRRLGGWAAAPIAVALVALAVFVVVSALPVNRSVKVSAPVSTQNPDACNGYVALCSRAYNDVSYPTTHNSMSAADEPGWFIPEQPTGLVGQLNAGIRTLLIDSWYGSASDRKNVITNVGSTAGEAFAQANAEYGSSVVESALRLRSALKLVPHGPVAPYLCHQICALGSTPMLAALKQVQQWMAAHPREVVTFIIEDYISADDTAKMFEQAGLMPYVHTQIAGQPWPTLEQMISSGRRLQVFDQSNAGGAAHPWLLKAWDWIQDTPYDNSSAKALSCSLLRGTPSNPLFLINNLITKFDTRVSDSAKLNAYSALFPYASKCQAQRGQIPNFIAVDFYNKGNVFAVVNALNKVS